MDERLTDLIREVLERGYLMSLATADDGGAWCADVIYVHDDDHNIYWMSDPEARHSQAITENAQVAGAITISGQGEKNVGIQFSGSAEKINGARFDLTTKHFAKRGKPAPREDEDVLEGDSWYVLKPAFIELIHEEHFGFEKKKLIS